MASLTTKISTLALLSNLASGFWRMPCQSETGIGRIDPIVDFGAIGSHVHTIHGSGNFNFTSTAKDLLSADCTSCMAKEDRSAYWTPTMYFMAEDGTTEMVDEVGGVLVYYRTDQDPSNPKNPTAFPNGFKMVSGDTDRRSWTGGKEYEPESNWQGWEKSQRAMKERALGFNCLDYSTTPEPFLGRHEMPSKKFIDQNCPDGIRLELVFPSCWNGKSLDSEDHKSHMAFPDGIVAGSCPESHPVKMATLFFETIVQTAKFKDNKGKFVFSNGDDTGYGFHGDVMIAWEPGVLQRAINNCKYLSGEIQSCPEFTLQDFATMNKCKFDPIPALQIDGSIKGPRNGLPGNVQVSRDPKNAKPADAGKSKPQHKHKSDKSEHVGQKKHGGKNKPKANQKFAVEKAQVTPAAEAKHARPSAHAEPAATSWSTDGDKVYKILVHQITTTATVLESTPSPQVAPYNPHRRRHHRRHHMHGLDGDSY